MNFGERLRMLRNEKGLTQAELAKMLSIGESTVSFYESGKRQPDYETLLRFAETFKVSTDFLLCKTDIRYSADDIIQRAGRTNRNNNSNFETIAAHHEGEDWTQEELEDIERFKEFVRMKRQQRQQKE